MGDTNQPKQLGATNVVVYNPQIMGIAFGFVIWGGMFQGGEDALQAPCEGFDSPSLHQTN